MRAFIFDPGRFIVHPGAALARMTSLAAFDTALILLLLFALLLGITTFYGQRMRAIRGSAAFNADHLLKNIAAVAGVLLAVWLLATLLFLEILQLLGAKTSFEAVFSVLVFASVARFLVWAAYPLQNWRREAFWGFRILTFGALIWTTWLLCSGFPVLAPLPAWKTFCAVLLPLGLLWSEGIWEIRSEPDSLTAAYPWKRAIGEQVVVFYPPGKDRAHIEEIVRGCDRMLMDVTTLLEVTPLSFKVYVFLFGDSRLHRRVLEEKGRLCSGYAHGDSISLVYAPWEAIGAIVAHEFCHVLREQRITNNLLGLLDEGLACYAEHSVYAWHVMFLGEDPPAARLQIPLRILARPAVFYEWLYASETDYTAHDYYVHAHAFAGYLIGREGMAAFKELCRLVQKDPDGNPGDRLAEGIRQVYGVSIQEMECQWRQPAKTGDREDDSRDTSESSETQQPNPPRYGWDHFTEMARRIVWHAYEEANSLHQSRIATEHLLLALVSQPESVAVRLLARQGFPARRIYQETKRFAPRGVGASEKKELAPDGKRAIELAYKEARQLGDNFIGTEHLLLGLLREEEGLAGQILTRQGLMLDAVRCEIQAIRDGS